MSDIRIVNECDGQVIAGALLTASLSRATTSRGGRGNSAPSCNSRGGLVDGHSTPIQAPFLMPLACGAESSAEDVTTSRPSVQS